MQRAPFAPPRALRTRLTADVAEAPAALLSVAGLFFAAERKSSNHFIAALYGVRQEALLIDG